MIQRQKTFLSPADNKSNLETMCMREEMDERDLVRSQKIMGEFVRVNCHTPILHTHKGVLTVTAN